MSNPPRYLSAAWDPDTQTLIAAYGGADVATDTLLIRALAKGPAGSTVRLYVGPDIPSQLVQLGQHEVDYDLVGAEAYASWDRPLRVPAGWYAVFGWTSGSTGPTSTGTVRLEYADASEYG